MELKFVQRCSSILLVQMGTWSGRFLNVLSMGAYVPEVRDYNQLIRNQVATFGVAVMTLVLVSGLESGAACAAVSEWLRSWTRNPMGFARTGSNPVRSVLFFLLLYFYISTTFTSK